MYLKPAPGEVDNQGTPVNAENLNHMDEGILNLDQNKVNATDGDVSDTVATFDQNPTTAPENIASGDRLGTLFGKIYNVIKDFFSHKSDKEIHTTRAEKNSWNNSLSDAKTYADAMYSQLTGYTDKKVADLIGGAPETLDTIEEVATAIKENENVVKALDAAIGKKANQNELDTHISNDSIHVDAAKQAKWDGYEQRITDINNNLPRKLLWSGNAKAESLIYFDTTRYTQYEIIVNTGFPLRGMAVAGTDIPHGGDKILTCIGSAALWTGNSYITSQTITVCDVYDDHIYVQSIIDYASDNNQYKDYRAIIAVYGLT